MFSRVREKIFPRHRDRKIPCHKCIKSIILTRDNYQIQHSMQFNFSFVLYQQVMPSEFPSIHKTSKQLTYWASSEKHPPKLRLITCNKVLHRKHCKIVPIRLTNARGCRQIVVVNTAIGTTGNKWLFHHFMLYEYIRVMYNLHNAKCFSLPIRSVWWCIVAN